MPQEQVDRYADIVTGIMGGMRGQGTQITNRADPGLLQSALAAAATGFESTIDLQAKDKCLGMFRV